MQEHLNEWLYRQIVDGAQDAIIHADREGRIALWNSGAAVVFGYSAEEAIGQSLDLIIPERLRSRHWEGYHRVMATGSTRYGRESLKVPAVRKDGARISVEFTMILVRSPDEELSGCAAIIQDVTARWQKEQELKSKERRCSHVLLPMRTDSQG